MIAVQYLLLFFVILLFAVAYPLSGYYQQKILSGRNSGQLPRKIHWYKMTMLWAWTPTIIVITTVLLGGFRLRHLGLKPLNLSTSGLDNWIIILFVALYIVYICYNFYSLFSLKINPETRSRSLKQIPAGMRAMLPVTGLERRGWILVSVTAGITEEVLYRGYLFFAIALLFPSIPIWVILIISSFLFALGHIYQGKHSLKPALAGIFYGVFYIVFDSIVPVIFAHLLQDAVVLWLMKDSE